MRNPRIPAAALTVLVFGAIVTGCATGGHPAPSPKPSPTASPSATVSLSSFAGTWTGHTRSLVIDRQGHAKESVGDGCCHPIVDLALQLDEPTGTADRATFTARITAVSVHDASELPKPLPAVGQRVRLQLKNGVMTDSVTELPYCSPRHTTRRQGLACGA